MSLHLQSEVSLKAFNSFGVEVNARLFAQAHNDDEVREALRLAESHDLPLLVIGGGSNLLLTRDVGALVLRMASRGIRILEDDGERVLVEGGRLWLFSLNPWSPYGWRVRGELSAATAGLESQPSLVNTQLTHQSLHRYEILGLAGQRLATKQQGQKPVAQDAKAGHGHSP